jgi:[acyl-carrier-protein] S-malonyltransferase
MGTDASTALLFPGQGSQTDHMADLVREQCPDLHALTLEEMGTDPFPRINEGTRYAQPAMFCASIACWERAGRPLYDPIAGHSLGELAALVAAGCLDARDGLRLAVRRGSLMQKAAERDPGGGMLALLGDDRLAARVASDCGLAIANDNAPGQIVLTGPGWRLDGARALAKRAGLKSMRLAVGGAFHSPEMRWVLPDFRAALDEVDFAPPLVRVYSSIAAGPFGDPRADLASALVKPVRWRQTLLALHRAGVRAFREVGPGEVLTKLVRRTLDGVEAISLDQPQPARA